MCWQRYRRPQKSGDVFQWKNSTKHLYHPVFLGFVLFFMTHTSDSQFRLADVQSASCKKKNMLQNIFMDFFPLLFFLPTWPTHTLISQWTVLFTKQDNWPEAPNYISHHCIKFYNRKVKRTTLSPLAQLYTFLGLRGVMCWQQGLELAEEVVLSTQHIFLSYSSLSIYYSSQHITVSLHNAADSLNMYVFCFLMCCLKCKSATCGYFRIYLNLKHHCEACQKYCSLLFFTPNYFFLKSHKMAVCIHVQVSNW